MNQGMFSDMMAAMEENNRLLRELVELLKDQARRPRITRLPDKVETEPVKQGKPGKQ